MTNYEFIKKMTIEELASWNLKHLYKVVTPETEEYSAEYGDVWITTEFEEFRNYDEAIKQELRWLNETIEGTI